MSTDGKVRIYKSIVRPDLFYAAKTPAKISKTKSIGISEDMRTLRSVKGISLQDHIKSSIIRELTRT